MVPVGYILYPYLPNSDDGSKIIIDYQLENAFPNLEFEQIIDLEYSSRSNNLLYSVEQRGVINVFENNVDTSSSSIFLDIRDRVKFGGEMGLLGLAFHPDFDENGYFFVDYITEDNGPLRSIISRFSTINNLDADQASELILLEVEQPYTNHNGGDLFFDQDGYLFISLGDGGLAGDPLGSGQNISSLLGSILRIDIDNPVNGKNYGIPNDNPFVGIEGRDEIYAYGLRNPWRMSFDNYTDQIWTGDVGQNMYEEVNKVEKGGNYGWNEWEGFHCYDCVDNTMPAEMIPPIIEYNHSIGFSVTGGYVYRGSDHGDLFGKYIYGDYGTGRIWSLEIFENGTILNELIIKDPIGLTAFGVDKYNELYVLSISGMIYKLQTI